MKKRFRLLFAFTLLALTSLACNISQVSKIFGEYPPNSGDLLFQDGFSDPSSGWDQISPNSVMSPVLDASMHLSQDSRLPHQISPPTVT